MSEVFIRLLSNNELLAVDLETAKQSNTLLNLIESFNLDKDPTSAEIPLDPEYNSKTVRQVFEYVAESMKYPKSDENKKEMELWDKLFFDKIRGSLIDGRWEGTGDIFNIMKLANYLDIKSALNASTKYVALHMIRGKTPEELRYIFSVPVETKS